MSGNISYRVDTAGEADIETHLRACDTSFEPPLSSRIALHEYAHKLSTRSVRCEAWVDGSLAGLVAVYCNDINTGIAFVTSVSVLPCWTGRGIAMRLMSTCMEQARAAGMRQITLEAGRGNLGAIGLYQKIGFVTDQQAGSAITMKRFL